VYREIGGDGVVRESSGAVVLDFGGVGRVGVRRRAWDVVKSKVVKARVV
jgi:hypothetical protein